MKCLKENYDTLSFINAVKKCQEDVCLTTSDGDHLNLKSSLCQYIFAFASSSDSMNRILKNAVIDCKLDEDYQILDEFLTDSSNPA